MNKLAVTPFAQSSQTSGNTPNRQQLLQQLAQLWQQGATQACFDVALLLTLEFPREGIAWKVLGGLLQQRGDLPGASEALAQAVKLLKKDAEVFLNAANVAAQQGDHALAIKHYRQAIRLNPSMTRAYANLASLLKEDGQQKEAEKLLRTAWQINKQDPLVLFDLAALLHESGKSLEAVQYFRQAIKIEPDNAVLAYNMAQVLSVLGNLDEALAHFEQAIGLSPTYFDALHQYGHCLCKKNQFKEAEEVWLQARALKPDHWQLLNDLAQLYKQLQQPIEYAACVKATMQVEAPDIDELNNFTAGLINQQLFPEAERYCEQALSLGIENPFTYGNMALLLYYKQDYPQSLEYYEKALQLAPDCAAFWSNYSVSLRLLGEVERARQALEKAIALDPDYLDSYINLGSTYLEQGAVKSAVETYVKLIARAPHLDKAYRNLLYTNSFANELSQEVHLQYARACGELFMSQAEPFNNWLLNAQDQRLRIGLVSADLRSHPVGYFLEHWLKHVDAGKTEIYAYCSDGREDHYSQVLKKHCSQWRSLAGMNDARAASVIREDGIHILLDLSGYTADSRVSLFAWRPAPVQASWLGYWDTTGIPAMNVVIADPMSVPDGSEGQFTETVVKLPHTRLCFSAPQSNEQVNALPALKNGYVTFGCFQKYSKVSDEVLAVWAQVFKALPDAKLYWQCKAFQDDQVQAEALARLQKTGIQPQQCVLMRPTTRDAYFKSYHAVDLILDSFPFNGGTTTCEALWMGVPTLTMPGQTMISRQGASMMSSAGLPDWIAADKQAFVQKAIQFAADVPALANLRAGLRAQVMHSPLMDGERFARDMEKLLWNLWQTQVDGVAEALLSSRRIQDAYIGQDPVWIVSATRASEEAFWASSALGVSLKRHMQQDVRIVPHVYYENARGLSEVFNEAMTAAPENALVIFAHDDIWLDQTTFVQTVMDGLAAYDVIGVAGTARMWPKQPAWLFPDLTFSWEQSAFLRGKVAHNEHPFGRNTYFGAEKGDCVLMDGVLMATYKRTLMQANVRYDTQFDFEFYDLDFCRTASKAGLRLGVWPISLTHQSKGNYGKQRWRDKYQLYLRKWNEGEAANGTPMTAELSAALEEVLGLALQHQQAGDLQTAAQLYQEMLAVAPQSAPALFNLGLIAWTQSRQQEAVALFKQAHNAHPVEWEYLQHYLVALHATASLPALSAAFEQAMALPQHREAVQQLAAALQKPLTDETFEGETLENEQASSLVSAMQPDASQQQALLVAFEQQEYGQMEQALHTYLSQYPQWLAGWKMLADVLMLQKKDASEAAKQALALNAQDPQEHCYYGIVLKTKGDLPGAAAAFRHAIALKTDYAAAYNNLGTVLKDLGQVKDAIDYFKCALALQPGYADCFSNLLFCMTHAEHIDQAALMQAHQAYADLYEAPLKSAWLPHQNARDAHRTLNIGWVSADFRAHSVAHFVLPLIAELAKETSLRLVAYANQPLVDLVTTQMQGHFSSWHEVSYWSDQALAEQIRADGIDILIDLSGHTSGNRLLTFARKPAPIQVSWLGYLNTTGLSSMDYYLADPYLLPAGQFDDQFTEKLVQLPVNATFTPDPQAPAVNALPALSNGYVTFGCFNRILKITQATVQQWAALMQALPDSRLVIGGVGEGESTQHLQTWFAEAGIAAERIRYYPRVDMATYLRYYHEVDICLDTFPSNGVTTTAHALWMGVPTLCVEGDRMASRGAMALMQHLGLQDWVTHDQEQFVTQGLVLCSDVRALADLRNDLRSRFAGSALTQTQAFAHAFTQVLRHLWTCWCHDIVPATQDWKNLAQTLVVGKGKQAMDTDVVELEATVLEASQKVSDLSNNTRYLAETSPAGTANIYQVYYSAETMQGLESGFIPLDNSENLRPDWYEYWPIRNFILSQPLDENTFYGFFSPKFKSKTGLTADEVHRFIQKHADQADVILFSPFYDQTVLFANQFQQGIHDHPGIEACFRLGVQKIAPNVNIDTLVMHSGNSVYSNYFVAKPSFWRLWLEKCEVLFAEAEQGTSELAKQLNATAVYGQSQASNKVFLLERIVSLLIATQPGWRVKAYDASVLPHANSPFGKLATLDELKQLDHLKKAACAQQLDAEALGFSALKAQIQHRIEQTLTLELQQKSLEKQTLQQQPAADPLVEIFNQAEQYQHNGDIDKAIPLYKTILAKQPTHAGANHNLGWIETHTLSVKEALPRFEMALKADPNNEQYWVSYIDAMIMTDETILARQAIEEGMKYALTDSTATMLWQELDTRQASHNASLVDPEYTLQPERFVIYAPVYSDKSAGVKMLHVLCDALNRRGYQTVVCFMIQGQVVISNNPLNYGPDLKWYALTDHMELRQFIKEGIVVYPEIVSGNPLNAKHVVRYMLNAEGVVAKNKIQASVDDFILAFSASYHPNPHAFLNKVSHYEGFNTEGALPTMERNMDLTYIGKGDGYGDCPIVPGSVELTRTWPKNKAELAILLKNTRYFYTWDWCTQTVTDAMLCGAIPVYLSLAPYNSFDELHPGEAAYEIRASAKIEQGTVLLDIPEDYEARIQRVLTSYRAALNTFDNTVDQVLLQIVQHFRLQKQGSKEIKE